LGTWEHLLGAPVAGFFAFCLAAILGQFLVLLKIRCIFLVLIFFKATFLFFMKGAWCTKFWATVGVPELYVAGMWTDSFSRATCPREWRYERWLQLYFAFPDSSRLNCLQDKDSAPLGKGPIHEGEHGQQVPPDAVVQ
jgi:hypothetical protein